MAQALFDDHPLEEYLRSTSSKLSRVHTSNTSPIHIGAGEDPEFIPGSSAALELELELLRHAQSGDSDHLEEFEWRPLFLIQMIEVSRLN